MGEQPTRAQRELLAWFAGPHSQRIVFPEDQRNADAMVDLGLLEKGPKVRPFAGAYVIQYEITDAGRKSLAP